MYLHGVILGLKQLLYFYPLKNRVHENNNNNKNYSFCLKENTACALDGTNSLDYSGFEVSNPTLHPCNIPQFSH
jgi:hypothetical protein